MSDIKKNDIILRKQSETLLTLNVNLILHVKKVFKHNNFTSNAFTLEGISKRTVLFDDNLFTFKYIFLLNYSI